MDIWVLNQTHQKIGLIDTYESFIWTERYFKSGDCELVVPATDENLELLQYGNYLTKGVGYGVCRIYSIEIQTNVQYGDRIIVKGKDVAELMNQRINIAQKYSYQTVRNAISVLIVGNIMLPSQNNRQISGIISSIPAGILQDAYNTPMGFDPVLDKISELITQYGYGFKMPLDSSNRFVFTIYEGEDRSLSQGANDPVYFTEELDNLASTDYIESYENFKNAVYITGEGEGTDREMVQINQGSGADRFELYIDGGSISKKTDDGTMTDAQYQAALTQTALDKLTAYDVSLRFSGEIVDQTHVFGVDYFLGDIVTIYNKLGMAYDARITQVIESDDVQNGHVIIPTFEVRNATVLDRKAQAVLTADKVLTFIYGTQLEVGGTFNGSTIDAVYDVPMNVATFGSVPWFDDTTGRPDITSVTIDSSFASVKPTSIYGWFADLWYATTLNGAQNLKTDRVTNMQSAFYKFGHEAATLSLDLAYWNTSNVTNMRTMFYECGYSATAWSLTGLQNWNTSKVKTFRSFLNGAAYSATSWNWSLLTGWNTGACETMSRMFRNFAHTYTGMVSIGILSAWDVSKVKDFSYMFMGLGYSASNLSVSDLSNWNTESAENMSYMFTYFAYSCTLLTVGSLANWKTGKVTDMNHMFNGAGRNNLISGTPFPTGLGSWDVSKVTDFNNMFYACGYNRTGAFSVGSIEDWDTGEAVNMDSMFGYFGLNATYTYDLSDWDVANVTSHTNFNQYVSSKVIAPSFPS